MSAKAASLAIGRPGSGRIDFWDGKRGYGFVATGSGERLFVHISDIARIGTDPRVGDQISFVVGFGRDGRPVAKRGRILGANLKGVAAHRIAPVPRRPAIGWRSGLAVLMLVCIFVSTLSSGIYWPLLAYGVLGVGSFALYGLDKTEAIERRWRVPEVHLHSLDLVGGIVGGLFAQDVWRHKTAKTDFAAITVVIASVHLIWLVGVVAGRVTWPDFAIV